MKNLFYLLVLTSLGLQAKMIPQEITITLEKNRVLKTTIGNLLMAEGKVVMRDREHLAKKGEEEVLLKGTVLKGTLASDYDLGQIKLFKGQELHFHEEAEFEGINDFDFAIKLNGVVTMGGIRLSSGFNSTEKVYVDLFEQNLPFTGAHPLKNKDGKIVIGGRYNFFQAGEKAIRGVYLQSDKPVIFEAKFADFKQEKIENYRLLLGISAQRDELLFGTHQVEIDLDDRLSFYYSDFPQNHHALTTSFSGSRDLFGFYVKGSIYYSQGNDNYIYTSLAGEQKIEETIIENEISFYNDGAVRTFTPKYGLTQMFRQREIKGNHNTIHLWPNGNLLRMLSEKEGSLTKPNGEKVSYYSVTRFYSPSENMGYGIAREVNGSEPYIYAFGSFGIRDLNDEEIKSILPYLKNNSYADPEVIKYLSTLK
jgi:hypothetical protein